MILGGCFSLRTDLARNVGGCDELFSEYGFEETSLATKAIIEGAFVVPVIYPYALHLSAQESPQERDEKTVNFRRAHKLYFKEYLRREYEI